MSLQILNPLPEALHHYEKALVATLRAAGAQEISLSSSKVEAGERGLLGRASAHLLGVLGSRSAPALLLWPTFGYAEVLLDAVINPRLTVVFHDARPLRRQFGMRAWQGQLVGRVPRVTRAGRCMVHSRSAQVVLQEMGWDAAPILPHPLLAASEGSPATSGKPICLVLGQFKPTRDATLLEALPALLPGWRLRAVGRGWPSIRNWEVESRFVPEERVHAELVASTVVLIPYQHFFQSGVLVRAFEVARPAVTVRHEQTSALYGSDWVGTADTWTAEAVAEAVHRAAAVGPSDLLARIAAAQSHSVTAWGAWAASLS